MYSENIPTVVMDTVQTLYGSVSFDSLVAAATETLRWPDAGSLAASVSLVLSQAAFVVSILLAAFIAYVAMQQRVLDARAEEEEEPAPSQGPDTAAPAGALRDRWDAVLAQLDSVRESDWKVAVIEADTLVNDALARAGFPGETFGDRLSNISPGTLVSLDGIWWAHKVRNRLAHEADYFLRYTEARQAVGYYEAALAELRLI